MHQAGCPGEGADPVEQEVVVRGGAVRWAGPVTGRTVGAWADSVVREGCGRGAAGR
ncbi:hypothetical protein GCM10010502_23550 [Kitasatospora aureofaciens]|uniref:Uncharacterized protein n=1 Tax=Kitasatospora aureofaciens TaxID=1894 RepID=A0A8H9HN00_KITAU|nr:hypothetical protein GCM10010502_23550 [Kitasatospora aureofaciens]